MNAVNEEIERIGGMSSTAYKAYLRKASLSDLKAIKGRLDQLYYVEEGTTSISDSKYDLLKEILIDRTPEGEFAFTVGAAVNPRDRVSLPYFMGSMDKLTSDNTAAIDKWFQKNKTKTYSVESKLDGQSALLNIVDGRATFYTRGDKTTGRNISFVLPYINGIPTNLTEDIAVRGELIVKDEIFERDYKRLDPGDKTKFVTPLNMVVGLTARKEVSNGLGAIDFVAYELVGDEVMPPPQQQIKDLKRMGFTVVEQRIFKKKEVDTPAVLEKLLVEFRTRSPYTLDGIIVQSNSPYDRSELSPSGSPLYAFAFKKDERELMKQARVDRS